MLQICVVASLMVQITSRTENIDCGHLDSHLNKIAKYIINQRRRTVITNFHIPVLN